MNNNDANDYDDDPINSDFSTVSEIAEDELEANDIYYMIRRPYLPVIDADETTKGIQLLKEDRLKMNIRYSVEEDCVRQMLMDPQLRNRFILLKEEALKDEADRSVYQFESIIMASCRYFCNRFHYLCAMMGWIIRGWKYIDNKARRDQLVTVFQQECNRALTSFPDIPELGGWRSAVAKPRLQLTTWQESQSLAKLDSVDMSVENSGDATKKKGGLQESLGEFNDEEFMVVKKALKEFRGKKENEAKNNE